MRACVARGPGHAVRRFLSKAKRKLARSVWPRRLRVADALNRNAEFESMKETKFADCTRLDDRVALHEHVCAEYVKNQPITYLEFGVWRGESMARWAGLNSNESSRFYGFDTFEGLPEDWNKLTPKGSFDTGGEPPPIGDQRVQFIKGLFQDTLYDFLDRNPCTGPTVIHIDCDLYASTLFALAAMDRISQPGTIIIFDEFHDLTHEFAAFDDYVRSFYRTWDALACTANFAQVAIRITGRGGAGAR